MFFEKTDDAALEAELIPLLRKLAMVTRAKELARRAAGEAAEQFRQVVERLDAVQNELERRYAAAAVESLDGVPSLTLEEN